jgi:MFS transporter, CP family, cyanate transporter
MVNAPTLSKPKSRSRNKWAILALVTFVNMLVIGFPWTVMPVLFSTAGEELHLSLGQLGALWSMLPIGCASVALLGGMMGDRIGFTRAVGIGCFAVAVANFLRGISPNFAMLGVSMFLCGGTVALIFPNLQRMGSIFFTPRELGIATGIQISGFAIGGVLTTALAATVIMPLVGSWRNVLYLYSSICLVMGVIWFIVMRGTESAGPRGEDTNVKRPSFGESMLAVFKVKEIWLLSLGNLGVVGSFISLNGYLPVYLEKIGLSKSMGDTMSSTLFVASIVGAIGIPALADRVGGPKAVMIASAILTAASIILLSVAPPTFFWVLIPLAGCVTQGVGTLVITHAMQIKQLGSAYVGTALGLIGACANLGGFVMPLLGGRLAETNHTWPFFLWSLISLSGTVCFLMLSRTGRGPAPVVLG